VRQPILTWGATAEEAAARLPGDELLQDAEGVATRVITIDAPRSAVWPWIAQMGPSPRGGADDDSPTINAALVTRVTAPTVAYPSPAATAVTATSARLSAIVDPRGADTGYEFDYGTSTAYGETGDAGNIAATNGPQTVSVSLEGLSPGTTYHFRATAVNSVGETDGADQTFTTTTCSGRSARDRGFEVALGHASNRTAAAGMLRRASKVARGRALVERDGCTDYEPAIAGLTRKGAAAALRRAKRLGFRGAAVEKT
jgi:Fibronectin type III domain